MTPDPAIRAVLLAFGLGVGLLLLWRLGGVLLLVFAAILLAILLSHPADFLRRHLPIGRTAALLVTILLVLVAAALAIVLIGPSVAAQAQLLWQRLPTALGNLERYVRSTGFGNFLLSMAPPPDQVERRASSLLPTVASTFTGVAGGLGSVVVLVILALFLAANPRMYRDGLLQLLPRRARRRGREVMNELARGLWLWLIGQLLAMLLVGTLTTIGLWAIGIPLALVLGVIAGLLDFVPFVGPVVAAVPAILIGLLQSPSVALWVLLLFIVVQQLEGNVLMPLIQRWVTSVPPALTIVSILVLGALTGLVGIVLAVPLGVVVMILVKMLYVQDVLGESTELPGDAEPTAPNAATGRRPE